ncbi:MAG: 1-deoxy-D-xylulose-5-phosphate reductoisomerase [Clostridia bacterium]|nr:1-deoxy-D-xylulose-5-phosphate reductoisomerase [Clostridia bacterium]
MERIAILGSTGSVGLQALNVADSLGLRVVAISAGRNISLLEEQARKYRPELVSVMDEAAAGRLRAALADTPVRVVAGVDGLCEAACCANADLVLNAVVGIAGLLPTLAAIRVKKHLALANKETLVAGGALVMREARENGVRILPVDSEHSAIFQCLEACEPKQDLKKLILTASGGPFFGYTREQLAAVTPEQALRHPNWTMGPKVTVDSASMMNKGLELIEASCLFEVEPSSVDVVVHRESIIHSLIELNDHSVLAQLGPPDMRLPIQYAFTYPRRVPSNVAEIDLAAIGRLTFYQPDEEAFKCLRLCRQAIEEGGLMPAVANAANEEAVGLFLGHRVGFNAIGDLVEEAMKNMKNTNKPVTVEDILAMDAQTRVFVRGIAGK